MSSTLRSASFRLARLLSHINPHKQEPARAAAAEDELDVYIREADEARARQQEEEAGVLKQQVKSKEQQVKKFVPYLVIPPFTEEAVKSVFFL